MHVFWQKEGSRLFPRDVGAENTEGLGMEAQATPGQPQFGGECKLMSYFPSFSWAGP